MLPGRTKGCQVVENIIVNEIGLRDGLQIHPEFVPTEDKLALVEALVAAGVASFEATSFVSPAAVPQMADADELFPLLPNPDRIAYHALVANERGYDRARQAGVESVAFALASTDTFNRKNINKSFGDAMDSCLAVIARGRADGVFARAYIGTACACPYEGVTPPQVVFDIADRLFNAGAEEVGIADTIDAGSPAQVSHLFAVLVAKYGADRLSAHFHDTRAMGLALSWAAVQTGIRRFDSSIGGLGGCPFAPGATGNLATEDLVFMLNESGYETGIDIDGLRKAAAVAARITNRNLGGRITDYLVSQDQRRATAAT